MTLQLSSIIFHKDSQPDFDKLRAKGREHPLGLRDEVMERLIVMRRFSRVMGRR